MKKRLKLKPGRETPQRHVWCAVLVALAFMPGAVGLERWFGKKKIVPHTGPPDDKSTGYINPPGDDSSENKSAIHPSGLCQPVLTGFLSQTPVSTGGWPLKTIRD